MKRSKPRHLAHDALAHVVDTGYAWFSALRWRALAWVLGIALCTAATVIMTGVAWVPMVGAAMVAAAVSINRVAAKLSKPVCYGCGRDLSGQPLAHLGVLCPGCGAIHQPRPDALAIGPEPADSDDDATA